MLTLTVAIRQRGSSSVAMVISDQVRKYSVLHRSVLMEDGGNVFHWTATGQFSLSFDIKGLNKQCSTDLVQ